MSTRRQASRLAPPPPAPPENGSHDQRNSVVLGPNDRLIGQLFIEGDLLVGGTVEGALEATGDIEITGSVNGQVTAYNRLVVGRDASLIGGDVRVARLTVEDGATFSGKVSMGGRAGAAASEAAPAPAVSFVPSPAEKPTPAAPVQVVPKAKRR